MKYVYKTQGTCSKQITVEFTGNVVRKVEFQGGCNGNLNGISKIVEGMTVDHIVETFKGTKCGGRSTSCPDQLAIALLQACQRGENEDGSDRELI